ncbi:MAG: ABC transporter substrate-binding protein [Rubrobacteraceae bacterium]
MRRRGLNRGEFLKIGGAGLAGAVLLGGISGCGGGEGGGGGMIYAESPDDTGSLPKLIDGFNAEYEGEYSIRHREMPADAQGYFDQLRTEFQAGASDIDVIAGDVIWPAQLAANGWLLDLSDRFTEDIQNRFIEGNVESNVYEGAIYGVPFVTGAGFLYYRADLLEESGFDGPPETWDELKEMARKVMDDHGTRFGFVFQGGNYEGGVVNGMEYIWTHGGDILDGNEEVVIASDEAAAGLSTYRSMISDGITTNAMNTYKEEEAQAAFLRGDAVFMRNWSYVYALAGDPEQSDIGPGQVGVAALPTSEGGETASALGATNLYINATSENAEGAWAMIEYITAPEQQRMRAVEGARLPVLKSSYEDEALLSEVPVMALGEEALRSARPRPVSPFYSDMSLALAEGFSAVLRGDAEPERVVEDLQEELEDIIRTGEDV